MTTSAFNHQLAKIESLLFGFAMKLTHHEENAKDLMQETLMRSFKNRDRFMPGSNFKSWTTTIMYNSFVNHYRKKQTRNKVIKPVDDLNSLADYRRANRTADHIILGQELNEIINKLKDDYKVPFKLFVEGYHYDEIAAKIDLPMGTVKSRIFYARKKLKAMITSKYGDLASLAA